MTEETIDLEAVKRRVRKLLAMAQDGRGDANEAAAAAGQAERIMRKYQIEHAEIIEASLSLADSFDTTEIGGTMNPEARAKSTTTWAGMLSLAIARLNDCKAEWVRSRELGVCLRYSGYKADVEVARWTHLYIVTQLTAALREFQKYGYGRKDCEGFRKGFIVAVVNNLQRESQRKQQEMAQAVASRALVVSKTRAVAERFGEQKVRGNSYSSSNEGFSAGHRKGSNVDVGRRGVSGNTSNSARISG